MKALSRLLIWARFMSQIRLCQRNDNHKAVHAGRDVARVTRVPWRRSAGPHLRSCQRPARCLISCHKRPRLALGLSVARTRQGRPQMGAEAYSPAQIASIDHVHGETAFSDLLQGNGVLAVWREIRQPEQTPYNHRNTGRAADTGQLR